MEESKQTRLFCRLVIHRYTDHQDIGERIKMDLFVWPNIILVVYECVFIVLVQLYFIRYTYTVNFNLASGHACMHKII